MPANPVATSSVRDPGKMDDKDPFWKMTRSASSRSARSSASSSRHPPSRLQQSIGSISRYHEGCHENLFDLEPEAQVEKKYHEKLSNLKRMILTVKMTQTPLELNYNGRASTYVPKLYTSQIPMWKPVSPYRPASTPPSLRTSQIKSSKTESEPSEKHASGPFVKSLVPHITLLATTSAANPSPYRSQFQSQYDRIYNELANAERRKPKSWY
ncbi:hypothetical protein HDV03_002911 [Kappamyces sp. JEL0829]|nr:hypothetical protein HDV03_002911 [Kappamyces sp. JEL0829]